MDDHDFSITLNGFFLVRWTDSRLLIEDVKFGPDGDQLVPVDISMVRLLIHYGSLYLIEALIIAIFPMENLRFLNHYSMYVINFRWKRFGSLMLRF